MAQIIKHRRGSLESVSGAVKRAGELLVVTGSAGITATNGNSILFVGIDGSTATPANKILQGTSVPNLTGASYDTSVDGIPFYDTSAQKLYILNKSGNVEIKATAQTGGTGIVSGSSQVTSSLDGRYELQGRGVVSGSSQLTSSYDLRYEGVGRGIVSSSAQVTPLLPAGTVSGSIQVLGGTGIVSSSAQIDALFNIDGVVSSSAQIIPLLPTGTVSGSIQVLGGTGIASSSAQVKSYLPAGTVSGSSQLNSTTIDSATLTNVIASGSFSGSFKGDGSLLTGIASTLAFSGSTGNDTLNLKTESLLVTGSTGITTAVTNNTITISGVDASTSSKGVSSFSSTNFAVSSGNVTIKNGGVTAATLAADTAGTGISLNGVDNSLQVDYGSTAGTAVAGNTSLIVQGTSNQVSVTNGSVTLGSGGTVTIGLPSSVTIATASIQNNLSVGGSVTVTGNLFVQGTTTTIDSTTISLGDNIIELNGSAAANGGLLVKDTTAPTTVSGSLLWDGTNDYWKGGALGSEKQFARLNATPTSGSVQVIGANGLLVDSRILDSGSAVYINTDVRVSGLTANSFLAANSSKTLISVAAVNDGDFIQWNGSSFVASNTIDGGTF